MGKWDSQKGKLPPKPFDDPKYRDKVDAKKLTYAGMDLKGLSAHYIAQRKIEDGLDDQMSEVTVELESLGQLIAAHFEALDVTPIKVESGQRFEVRIEPCVSVIDRKAFEEAIEANEELDYLWSVNAKTLETFVKGHLENGDDDQIPPGLKIYLRTAIRMVKAA